MFFFINQIINYYTNDSGISDIRSSSVMSYHSILKTSKDYYEALRSARIIADNLTQTINVPGVEVFPYR